MSVGILLYEFALFWGGIVWFRNVRSTQHRLPPSCDIMRSASFHAQTMSALTDVVTYILE